MTFQQIIHDRKPGERFSCKPEYRGSYTYHFDPEGRLLSENNAPAVLWKSEMSSNSWYLICVPPKEETLEERIQRFTRENNIAYGGRFGELLRILIDGGYLMSGKR